MTIAVCKCIGTLTPTIYGTLEGNWFILVTGIICYVFDVIYIFALSNKWGAVQRLLDCYWPQSQKASSSSIFKFVSKSLFSPLNRPPQAFSCVGLRRL